MRALESGDIAWEENVLNEDVIDVYLFNSMCILIRKEDFDGVIKNLQDIHKEFMKADSKKNVEAK